MNQHSLTPYYVVGPLDYLILSKSRNTGLKLFPSPLTYFLNNSIKYGYTIKTPRHKCTFFHSYLLIPFPSSYPTGFGLEYSKAHGMDRWSAGGVELPHNHCMGPPVSYRILENITGKLPECSPHISSLGIMDHNDPLSTHHHCFSDHCKNRDSLHNGEKLTWIPVSKKAGSSRASVQEKT